MAAAKAHGSCKKWTGGTCALGKCDGSRNADCNTGMCVCNAVSCAEDGKCVFNADEANEAMKNSPNSDTHHFDISSVTECQPKIEQRCIFGCNDDNAKCRWGTCECQEGYCGVGRKCVKKVIETADTAKWSDMLGKLSNIFGGGGGEK